MVIYEITGEDNDIIFSFFDSSNILKSVYTKSMRVLILYFDSSLVYSYRNFDEELYKEFISAESQGIFFSKHIKNNKNLLVQREFKMKDFEKKDILMRIDEYKKINKNDKKQTSNEPIEE